MHKNLEPFLIDPDSSVINGMKQIDHNKEKVLFVVDKSNKLIGSITDGDIRRWILAGESLNAPIEKICNRNPISIKSEQNASYAKELMLEYKIECVPVINYEKRVEKLIFWNDAFRDENFKIEKTILKLPVVIMAGGAGNRMKPFTQILPKPLIPVGDKTIIEHIIDKFVEYQINVFYITLNHKGRIIKYFLQELNPSFTLKFITEPEPLGTAGSLKYLQDKIRGTFIVTNCDIIIYADYAEIVHFHEENNYDLTLVSSMMHYQIPYGICEIDKGGNLLELKEKPEYSYLISTGMYILKSRVLEYIPEKKLFHMTDLMDRVKEHGGKIGVFPINEQAWADTGQWKEYKKTLQRLNNDQ